MKTCRQHCRLESSLGTQQRYSLDASRVYPCKTGYLGRRGDIAVAGDWRIECRGGKPHSARSAEHDQRPECLRLGDSRWTANLAFILPAWVEEDRDGDLYYQFRHHFTSRYLQRPRTAKTVSLPCRALTSPVLSRGSSTPRAFSFLEASESGSREIARGTNIPSFSNAPTTAPPKFGERILSTLRSWRQILHLERCSQHC
ncbi:hypothetical protein B0H14DRAFT_1319344 [Mycena olivaceomarginata]|nr:hypothetical protein B0H14DRAFT_1319344 [Mycena olivaceomarginata]